jgi:hypothetical protein
MEGFIDRQNDGIGRRGHIQADNVGRLGDEIRVGALAPGLATGQIDLLGTQEAPDILLVDIVQRTRQQRCAPVGISCRRWLIEHGEDALLLCGAVFGLRAAVASLVEACQAVAGVAHSPLRRRSRGAPHDPTDLARGQAVGRRKHDLRTGPHPDLGFGGTDQPLKHRTLCRRQRDHCRAGNRSHPQLES